MSNADQTSLSPDGEAIFERLEHALDAWHDELADARRELAFEFARARHRLAGDAEGRAEDEDDAEAHAAPPEDYEEAILAILREREEAAAAAEARAEALAARVADLEALTAPPAEEDEGHPASPPLLDDPDALRARIRALEREYRRMQAQVQGVHELELRERVLQTRLEEYQKRDSDYAEARAEVKRLQGLLEEANARESVAPAQAAPISATTPPIGRMANPFSHADYTPADRFGPAELPLEQPEVAAFDAAGRKRRMGEILVDAGVVDAPTLERLLEQQAGGAQKRLGDLLIAEGLTGEEVVGKVLAAQLQLPFLPLDTVDISPEARRRVSAHLARLHHAVPLRQQGKRLVVAMANPLDLIAIEDLELASRCQVEPVVATASGIEAALNRYYPDRKGAG